MAMAEDRLVFVSGPQQCSVCGAALEMAGRMELGYSLAYEDGSGFFSLLALRVPADYEGPAVFCRHGCEVYDGG
jgi:hypothetical protein